MILRSLKNHDHLQQRKSGYAYGTHLFSHLLPTMMKEVVKEHGILGRYYFLCSVVSAQKHCKKNFREEEGVFIHNVVILSVNVIGR